MAESASAHKMQAEEEASPEETGDVMEAPRDKVEATKDAEVVFSKSEEETRAAEGEDQARELTDEIPLETIADDSVAKDEKSGEADAEEVPGEVAAAKRTETAVIADAEAESEGDENMPDVEERLAEEAEVEDGSAAISARLREGMDDAEGNERESALSLEAVDLVQEDVALVETNAPIEEASA